MDGLRADPVQVGQDYLAEVANCRDTQDLLLAEAEYAKKLYALLSRASGVDFSRKPRAKDTTNAYLDSGNYLAYGLAACTLWVLGLSHSYPLMHGKTRRGALVFDLADVIKDAFIMPNAFVSATRGENESAARKRMLCDLHDGNALRTLFEAVASLIGTNEPSTT